MATFILTRGSTKIYVYLYYIYNQIYLIITNLILTSMAAIGKFFCRPSLPAEHPPLSDGFVGMIHKYDMQPTKITQLPLQHSTSQCIYNIHTPSSNLRARWKLIGT